MKKNIASLVSFILLAFCLSCTNKENITPIKDTGKNELDSDSAKSGRFGVFLSWYDFTGGIVPDQGIVEIASREGFTNLSLGTNRKYVLDVWVSAKLAISWEPHNDNNQRWFFQRHPVNRNLYSLKSLQFPGNDGYLQPGGPNGQLRVGPGAYYWHISSDVYGYSTIKQIDGLGQPTSNVIDFNWPWQNGSPVTLFQYKNVDKNQLWVFIKR